MTLAWFEQSDSDRQCIGAALADTVYDNSRTRNWELMTTLIRAIGYVAA